MELIPEIILRIGIGFVIGIAIGMTGIGGGALVEPSLIHLLGVSPIPAVGTGLGYNFITKLGGVIAHLRLKTIKLRLSTFFLVGSVPGVLIASNTINLLFDHFDRGSMNYFIQITMGIILVSTSLILFVQNFILKKDFKSETGPAPSAPTTAGKTKSMVAGLFIGAIIGTTSIGGGVLIIPALMIFLRASAEGGTGALAAKDGFVYISGGDLHDLYVFDANDPDNLDFEFFVDLNYGNGVFQLVKDTLLFVGVFDPADTASLKIFSIADASRPFEIGNIIVGVGYNSAIVAMAISGQNLFASQFREGVLSIEVSEPVQPTVEGRIEHPFLKYPGLVAASSGKQAIEKSAYTRGRR